MKKLVNLLLAFCLFFTYAQAANIAILYDANYVDITGTCGGDDVNNLVNTLTAQGHTVSTFTGTSTWI